MFIRWNKNCNEPFGGCNVMDEFDYLPFIEGDKWILPTISGTVSLVNQTTGVNLGTVSSSHVSTVLSYFEFSVSNIQSSSVIRLGSILNCAPSCASPIERSSYGTDLLFLEAVASSIATAIGSSYFIFQSTGVIRIFFNSATAVCGATLTVNTNFSNEDGTCLLPNILGDCEMPVVITEREGICSSVTRCLDMIQIQGFNICLAAITQPICVKGERTEINFPIGLNANHCFYLQLDAGRDVFCSQPLRMVCGDCFTSLIRARNNNEPYYQMRIAMYPHSKQLAIEGENTKNGVNKIQKLFSTQETVYTLTTDYYFQDIHFALAELLQKDVVEIFYNYEYYQQPRWEYFVLLDSYQIKYSETQPKTLTAQGEAKLVVNKYFYTNYNC